MSCQDENYFEGLPDFGRSPRSDESVGPFPQEPAPGSPEAVAQAAETIRGFTPGPWRRREPFHEVWAGTRHVATCPYQTNPYHSGKGSDEAAANAALIARAPELLAENERLRAAHMGALGRSCALEEQRDALADALIEHMGGAVQVARLARFQTEGDSDFTRKTTAALAALRAVGRLPKGAADV